MDMNDRALREIVCSLGGSPTAFHARPVDITVARR